MLAAASQLTTPDYAVIAVHLAGTIGLGAWLGRRLKTGSDFLLSGRRLPSWAIGMSLVAAEIGGTGIIGVGGAADAHGMAVANFKWIGCVPAMIGGLKTAPAARNRRSPPRLEARDAAAGRPGLFVATLAIVLIWASRLPRSATMRPAGARHWDENLKVGVTAALVVQIVIYSPF